jgi:hypothetical protein
VVQESLSPTYFVVVERVLRPATCCTEGRKANFPRGRREGGVPRRGREGRRTSTQAAETMIQSLFSLVFIFLPATRRKRCTQLRRIYGISGWSVYPFFFTRAFSDATLPSKDMTLLYVLPPRFCFLRYLSHLNGHHEHQSVHCRYYLYHHRHYLHRSHHICHSAYHNDIVWPRSGRLTAFSLSLCSGMSCKTPLTPQCTSSPLPFPQSLHPRRHWREYRPAVDFTCHPICNGSS